MAEQKNVQKTEQVVDTKQLLKVRRDKLAELLANGKDPFVITKYDVTNHSMEIKNNFEQFDGKTVRVAGRVMSKRVMGKASFCNVQDKEGNIQSYVARDSLGEEEYKAFKKMDIGISLVLKDLYSRQRQVRFLFMQRRSICFPRAFRFCRRNTMV